MHEGADGPFEEVLKNAMAWEDRGYVIFQKFTCARCGSRQSMPDAYKFYTSGQCEECGHVTDIRRCGFMAVNVGADRTEREKITELMETALRGDDPKVPDYPLATCVLHRTQYAPHFGGCPLCDDESGA